MIPLQCAIPGGSELLTTDLLYLIVPFMLAYWVYNDADKRDNENVTL